MMSEGRRRFASSCAIIMMNIPFHLEVPEALALIVAQADRTARECGTEGALGEG